MIQSLDAKSLSLMMREAADNDIQTWHRILGHCNYEDICILQDVAD